MARSKTRVIKRHVNAELLEKLKLHELTGLAFDYHIESRGVDTLLDHTACLEALMKIMKKTEGAGEALELTKEIFDGLTAIMTFKQDQETRLEAKLVRIRAVWAAMKSDHLKQSNDKRTPAALAAFGAANPGITS